MKALKPIAPSVEAASRNRWLWPGKSSLLSLSFILLLSGVPAWAAIGSDPRLAQLEVKFFKHPYPKDDDGQRLERLEKMVFGEVKTGADLDRLKALADTVPNLSSVTVADEEEPAAGNRTAGGGSNTLDITDKGSGRGVAPPVQKGAGSTVLSGESKYPAVTALEQSLFSRDYAGEPVADRLNRLETKVFGKPSKFTDLSERVDALKERTRVDVAKKPPPGSEWVEDEDDEGAYPTPARATSRNYTEHVARTDGDDARSFSGRDLRKDMQRAFGSSYPGGGGSYGSGGTGSSGSYGTGSSASGAYGMGGGSGFSTGGGSSAGAGKRGSVFSSGGGYGSSASSRSGSRGGVGLINPEDDDDDMPPPRSASGSGAASQAPGGARPDAPMMGAVGISQKVTSLETAVLGKNFAKDPLIDRVARLEQTVLPKQAEANASLSLPERVSKLLEKVPIAAGSSNGGRSMASSSRGSKRRGGDDFDDDEDMDMGSMSGMSGMSAMPGGGTKSGGLGKIINSIGNMLGSGFVGGYAMPGGTMVRDPSTGYLVDTMTGNMINPSTGAVVGRTTAIPGATMGMPLGGTTMGMPYGTTMGMPLGSTGYPINTMPYGNPYPYGNPMPMGGYSSFNNGFSPYGYGGTGLRFGTGGFGLGTGGLRFGGMWP